MSFVQVTAPIATQLMPTCARVVKLATTLTSRIACATRFRRLLAAATLVPMDASLVSPSMVP